MLDMLLQCCTVYMYVILEHQNKFSHEWGEDRVHQALEYGRAIGQPKGHDPKLEVAMVGFKRQFCAHPQGAF
jgi:hypothetical protein